MTRPRSRLVGFFVTATCLASVQLVIAGLALLFDAWQGDDTIPAIVALSAAGVGLVAGIVGFNGLDGGRRSTIALALTAVAQLVLAGVLASSLAERAADWRTLGLAGVEVAVMGALILVCAGMALAAARMLGRAPTLLAAAATAGAAGLVVGGAGLAVTGADCDRFRFDRERWAAGLDDQVGGGTSDRERIAHTLQRCDLLQGRTRAEVHAMLGGRRADRRDGGDNWPIGSTNDITGVGDSDALVVHYADGRVSAVEQLYD